MLAGAGVVLMDGWSAAETLALIAEHRITHSHMVPTMFHRLLSLPPGLPLQLLMPRKMIRRLQKKLLQQQLQLHR